MAEEWKNALLDVRVGIFLLLQKTEVERFCASKQQHTRAIANDTTCVVLNCLSL